MAKKKHTQPRLRALRGRVKKTNKPPSYYETIRKKRIYREGLTERVKMAREASGLHTRAVAAAMGIPHRRYLSYEKRSEMRPWFWNSFCSITGADLGFLMCEHRPSVRLEEDMHFLEMVKKHEGENSERYAVAVRVLARTRRALEQERRRQH